MGLMENTVWGPSLGSGGGPYWEPLICYSSLASFIVKHTLKQTYTACFFPTMGQTYEFQ